MTPMRRLSVLTALLVVLTTALSFTRIERAAPNYRALNLAISVAGTSTLHDWTIKSEQGQCDLVIGLANNRPEAFSGLSFSIPVESLKSGHGGMDKNTYKALKTDKFKNITFSLTSGNVTAVDATTYQLRAVGNLTIAGTTHLTDLVAQAKYNPADQSFTISGSKKLKMTDYGITPPSVMLGTIKAGNDITVSFNAKIVK